MKRMIKADSQKEYTVQVNFAGFIGSDVDYDVVAETEEAAIAAAIDEATSDLDVVDVEETDEGEYTVTVGYGGFVGVEEQYEVSADDADEACEAAIDEAVWDLTGQIIDEED